MLNVDTLGTDPKRTVKIALAQRLRRETTMPLKWICQELKMGAWKSINRLLYKERQAKR